MKSNSIIKLKNVSKFYYSKGVIASGFTKINLEFKMGEFVAITGESGSGKSTLLNVISGLDTYEEGEMYIDGKETSHYTEKDFEDYRRKYIGNIFQNFNLVNSYTVYQNIELVLLLNGNSKKKVKKEIIELIKKVGLYRFRNTKVSKLSGGQKQRVAIARALAKDTPMIIADEPTGNLDSKSAKEIIKLLSEISKDKLVIIVTHNYEQVEDYVTRKIKMHDGKVLEDKILKEVKTNVNNETIPYKNITTFNKLRLGVRNTFNVIPKFLLVLLVYLFLAVSIISVYASLKEEEYNQTNMGANYIFNNSDSHRIIIKKKDKSAFTKEDYEKINAIPNIDHIIENDLLIDDSINMTDNHNLWLYGTVNSIKNFKGQLKEGRLPENENEIVVEGYDYYIVYRTEEILDKIVYLSDYYTGELNTDKPYTIVGIKEIDDNQNYYSSDLTFYVDDEMLNELAFSVNQNYSKLQVTFMNKRHNVNRYSIDYNIKVNNRVPEGRAVISSDYKYNCPNYNCINQIVNINIKNNFYEDNINLSVINTYDKNNYKNMLGINGEFENMNGFIFINANDYNKLYNKGIYQSSVFVKDDAIASETGKEIAKLDYIPLVIKETYVTDEFSRIFMLVETIVLIVLIISVFFICYFVLNIILKSRNTYFATIRMLGANSKVAKQLLTIELFVAATLSYIIIMGFAYIYKYLNININFVNSINKYLKLKDYIILYIIIFGMSYFISKKYARKLFKKSAMKTIREEI